MTANGHRVPFGVMKTFWKYGVAMTAHHGKVLNSTELHTPKWLKWHVMCTLPQDLHDTMKTLDLIDTYRM